MMSIILLIITLLVLIAAIYYTKLFNFKELFILEVVLIIFNIGAGVILYLNQKNLLMATESNLRIQYIDSFLFNINKESEDELNSIQYAILDLQNDLQELDQQDTNIKNMRGVSIQIYDRTELIQSYDAKGDYLVLEESINNESSLYYYPLADYFTSEQLDECYNVIQKLGQGILVQDAYGYYDEGNQLIVERIDLNIINTNKDSQTSYSLGSIQNENSTSLREQFNNDHKFSLDDSQNTLVIYFAMHHASTYAIEGCKLASEDVFDDYYLYPFEGESYHYTGNYEDGHGSYGLASDGNYTVTISFFSDIRSMILSDHTFKDQVIGVIANSHFIVYLAYCFYLLYQQKKNSINQSKDLLISAIAHEMKTPTAVILNGIEMLKEDIPEAKKEYYLDMTYNQANHLNKMLMDMLNYARFNATYKLNKTNINLYHIVNELLEQYIQEDLKVNVFIDPNATIYGDEKLIKMVIDNFLNNAFEHTSTFITIRYSNHTFEVSNNGEMIPSDMAKHIWEPLSSKSQQKSNYKHTGIGLAISSAILKKHKFKYGLKQSDNTITFYFQTK